MQTLYYREKVRMLAYFWVYILYIEYMMHISQWQDTCRKCLECAGNVMITNVWVLAAYDTPSVLCSVYVSDTPNFLHAGNVYEMSPVLFPIFQNIPTGNVKEMCLKCHVSWLQDMCLTCHVSWLRKCA